MARLDDVRADLLHGLEKPHVVQAPLLLRQTLRLLLEHLRTRVGDGIDRMAQTVDESRAVARLPVGDPLQIARHLIRRRPVLDVRLDLLHLAHHAEVRATVTGTFERQDRRRHRGVDVGEGARHDVRGEGGVVAAAVLSVKDEREVERLRLQPRVAAILADHRQEVLRRGLPGIGVAEEERRAVVVVRLRLEGVGRNRRDGADEVDGLLQALLDGEVVGISLGIERVGEQDGARDGVHEVLRRVMHDRVFLEPVRKLAVGAEHVLPLDQLPRVGKFAEEQQVGRLLVAEAVFAPVGGDDVLDVDAAIVELTRDGLLFAFRDHVAMDVADGGQSHENARAIAIAKATLHIIFLIQRRIDPVNLSDHVRVRLQPFAIDYHQLSVSNKERSVLYHIFRWNALGFHLYCALNRRCGGSLCGLPVLGPLPSFAAPLSAHRLARLTPGVP